MRLADEDSLRKIALKQQKKEKTVEDLEITDEELNVLYEKASIDVDIMLDKTKEYRNDIKNFFYGDTMLEESLMVIFFGSVEKLLGKILPAVLEGNYDIIDEELMGDIDEESFNKLRLEVYENLKRRYL